MHLVMILFALLLVWFLRWRWSYPVGNWQERWQTALWSFLFGPLLLIMTAIALLCMGANGQMGGLQTGWFSYSLALSFLGYAVVLCLKLAIEGWRSVRQTRTYPQIELDGTVRFLDANVLFSAQVGFWEPELVVSRGLLEMLDRDHLDAVIAHEQGHYYYRDTFWFFWLGWMRSLTSFLPNTESLWQELLLLRELRADRWAAQKVDSLVLAESLLWVGSRPPIQSENFCAAFSSVAPPNRLTERIEALLSQEPLPRCPNNMWSWKWLVLAFLPLVSLPFHT